MHFHIFFSRNLFDFETAVSHNSNALLSDYESDLHRYRSLRSPSAEWYSFDIHDYQILVVLQELYNKKLFDVQINY